MVYVGTILKQTRMAETQIQKSSKLEAKLDKSDPLRYRQSVDVLTTPFYIWAAISVSSAAGVLLWSIFAKIPETTTSTGVLSKPFSIVSIPQPGQTGGTVSEVVVRIGDKVTKGQLIARYNFPDLNLQVKQAYESFKQGQSTYESQYESKIFKNLLEQQNVAVQSSKDYLNAANLVYKQGSISKSTVLSAQQSYEEAIQTKLQTVNSKSTSLSNVQKLRDQLESAKETKSEFSRILSPVSGEIVSLFISSGDQSDPTGVVGQIDTREQEPKNADIKTRNAQNGALGLTFISYFSPSEAAKLKIGQIARILPSNVKPNTVGTLEGKVSSIGLLPVSQTQVSSLLGSQTLAQQLLANGNTTQVVISLQKSSKFASGYRWINGSGPPANSPNQFPRIGILGSVSVVTEYAPPITIAIPALKRFFGISS